MIALQRKAELFSSPVAKEYLQSAFDAVSSAKLGNREDFGYPQGVPDRVASDWAEQLTGEVGRRALAAIGQKDAPLDRALGVIFDSRGPGFFSYRDPRKRTAFLDKLWPVLSQEARVQIASAPGIELREDITWTFAELGKPDEAKKLFNEVRASSSASATPPPIQRQVPPPFSNGDKTAQLFRLPAIPALPPEIKPVVFEPFEVANWNAGGARW